MERKRKTVQVTLKPVERVALPLLYFNKDLWQFERSLQRNLDKLRTSGLLTVDLYVPQIDGAAVDMARNRAVAMSLKWEADAIIWLDTDLILPDDGLIRLIQMANAGHMIAAGIYRRGNLPHHILAGIRTDYEEENRDTRWLEVDELMQMRTNGVVPVDRCAAGFSIVRTEVYRALPIPWYCNWDFVTERGQVGEDTFFHMRAAEIGVKPVVDPTLHAIHWNRYGPVPVTPDAPEMAYTV